MQVKHTLTMVAKCPVDSKPDRYTVEVTSDRVIKVEDILDACKGYEVKAAYQEQITVELARTLNCEVKTVGFHSGVKTEVVA